MKVFTARTAEIDDKQKALSEIKEQLDGKEYCKNTFALLYCHSEFIHSGVAEYICENLPFEVIGSSTTLAGFNKSPDDTKSYARGPFKLVISVMTADDITFKPVLTPPLSRDMDCDAACLETFTEIHGCKLGLAFLPYIGLLDGDAFIEKVVDFTGTPLFGGFACDDSATYDEDCFVIAGNKCYKDRAAFVFLEGNVHPHYRTAIVGEDKWMTEHAAIITKTDGNKIISINNRPVTEYLNTMGLKLTHNWSDMIIGSVLIIDDGDGDVYGRSMLFLDESDRLVLGGSVKDGSRVVVAFFEKNGILEAARGAAKEIIAAHPDSSFMIVSSCETRHIMLGADAAAGESMLRKEVGGIPFVLFYAGGEIHPTEKSNQNKPQSRLTNQSFCICVI
jgi:hypothetical protein